MRSRSFLGITLIFTLFAGAGRAWSQPQNFVSDVSTAIDRGLAWFQDAGYFEPGVAGDATGLIALTLLEKRPGGDPSAPPQGYSGASGLDQIRLDGLVGYLVSSADLPFFAYRNGQEMMALALYLKTGGPDQTGALAALNAAFDEAALLVGLNSCTPNGNGGCEPTYPTAAGVDAWDGYWCYMELNCPDSSTTQFVIAGMAAARTVFADPAYADPVRLGALNLIVQRSAAAYAANGLEGAYCGPGEILSPTERGHGYNVGSCNSFQQTASGAWVQLVGGQTINTPSVQGYLEWLRNRYRYTDNEANDWGNTSYGYGLWNASRVFSALDASPVPADPGSLTTASFGVLAPEEAPAYAFEMDEFGVIVRAGRQLHLNPADVPRPPAFGPEGPGYYAGASSLAPWYFDMAATIIARQDGSGFFESSSGWSLETEQAYHLLVLERSAGGGCVDGDGDGRCDAQDNCPLSANDDQADGDGDGKGDACDACPDDPTNDVDGDGICGGSDNCALVANGDQVDTDADGLGDACDACPEDAGNDADADGVCGNIDNCVAAANADQADEDGDAVGDACDTCLGDAGNDPDADGVCAAADNCDETANADQADADGDGIGDVCDNLQPAAVNDLATTPAGVGIEIAVLQNDTDPENDTLTVTAVTQPANGSVVIGEAGVVTYTPSPGFSGADAFTYTIGDGHGGTATGTVDVTVTAPTNQPPSCELATASVLSIWPPNHQLVPVSILGVTDPNGDAVTLTITGVFQDEPTNTYGDGNTPVDAQITGSSVLVRAERQGGKDGRVYHIRFSASDGQGGACTGEVTVCVPRDQGRFRDDDDDDKRWRGSHGYKATGSYTSSMKRRSRSVGCTDGGALYNSLVATPRPKPDHDPRGCRDGGHAHGRSDHEDWDREVRRNRRH